MTDSTSTDGIAVRDRTPAAIKADNLIRQRLRIGDPNNPAEVADGLKRLFVNDARASELEALGLPLLPARLSPGRPKTVESQATGAELRQAIDDVERDLRALTADHRLKDINAELSGWGQAIRSSISDGQAAARLALDPRARDRLFGARRHLGDYARLARLIGAMTQTMHSSYRQLARSLDEVASLLLVLAGETLAGAGLGGGRFELQSRRDSVLLALRTLNGTSELTYGNAEWPWSLHGLREMLLRIENSGHLDLRALLEESTMGRLLDELIERASQHNVLGLRALGATADMALNRLHRLLHIVDDRVQPRVPALTTFMKAIQLFLDAFRASRSGYRLLYVARAPISFYGLAGIGGPDPATQRLIQLVIYRGRLAELLDCYLGCECCGEDVICQILLDKILYDTDRAIDLYTLGSDPGGDGEPEWRAVAFAFLILEFLTPSSDEQPPCLTSPCFLQMQDLQGTLEDILELLQEEKPTPLGGGPGVEAGAALTAHRDLLRDELCLQRLSDDRLESVIATLAPGCVPGETVLARIRGLIDRALTRIEPGHPPCVDAEIIPPPTTESSLELLHDIHNLFRK
jgi:hypothetical protein